VTHETRVRRWRWLRHVAWVLGVKVFLIATSLVIFFGSGLGNPLLLRLLVRRIEGTTGGRVELRALSIRWLSLRATIEGLVIHGHEPQGTAPFFSAEEVQAGLRIDSFWGRKVSLNDLKVQQAQVHIRMEKGGSTNVPMPALRVSPNKPLREMLFDLHVRHVQVENSWLLYNDVRTPLAIEGGDMRLALDAGGAQEHPLYLGKFDWQSVHYTAAPNLPLPVNVSAKFTVWREGFALEQGTLHAGRSHIDVQAEMDGFAEPKWSFRGRGWVDLRDFRDTLRQPLVPSGLVDVRGEGSFAGGKFQAKGSYAGQEINLDYDDYHAKRLSSRGSYRIDNAGLEVPDFFAAADGGQVTGRVTLRFDGLRFRADTHIQDVRLSAVLPDVDHEGFPVDQLHWDAVFTGDTVETWSANFLHFEITGKLHWSPPDIVAAGHQPVEADWSFRYRYDPNIFTIDSGEFTTPTTRGTISGTLAPQDSVLDFHFETGALETYTDFINAVAGNRPGSSDAIKSIGGNVRWDGKIASADGHSVFQGHVRGEHVHFEGVPLDFLDGDVTYSQSELTLANGRARQDQMDVQIDGTLALTKWSFLPENNWSAEANFEKVPVENIQKFFHWQYPVNGLLTGQLHGRGTREEPTVTGLFDLAEGSAYGVSFNRLRGQLSLTPEEVRIANAELRVFPPGKENGSGAGIVTGMLGYRFADGTIAADLVGASLPLESFEKIQSERLKLSGQITFRMKASGPALAPTGEGTFRVVDFRIGQEIIGSFDGGLTSDGQIAKLTLGSAMTTGEISGGLTVGLTDPYRVNGKVSITNINLDPFLVSALHLKEFSGHGAADGDIAVNGELKHVEGITVDAKFSRLVLNYANVRLENSGPVHIRSSKEEFLIDPVTFRGTDTNLQLDGALRFSGRRTVSMHLNGAVDLRLLSGFVPDLEARGPAQINGSIEGPMDRPRITGRIHIENATARAADFPTGLSAIKGDIVFDATRLFFEDITAQAGGGTLHLSGNLNYADSPLRYEVNARTDRVRIRYPEGMSWLVAGSLRLTGTPSAGVLAGRVTVERVTLSQGLEVAGVLVSAKEGAISGPSTSSSFLRNLQFDVEAVSTPDARMEWPGAQLEAEAGLRVRGTWEHPILLGHIHILSGDLNFHGNRYRVARGDVNFANPFRLDPVVNVEATTTIQQYEITLNFNGPASKLTLAYRSDPPLPGNDIITLLALGQTSSEGAARSGGTSQSSTAGATAILSEAVSSQFGGPLQRLFGITRFRVDPGLAAVGSTSSEQNPGARVTVEQQIAHDLTITYVSNVSSTQEQIIQVEYNVNRSVSIVALRDQNGTFGIDVKIKKRFP
jgi:translocation and assembly module TamB